MTVFGATSSLTVCSETYLMVPRTPPTVRTLSPTFSRFSISACAFCFCCCGRIIRKYMIPRIGMKIRNCPIAPMPPPAGAPPAA